MTFTSAARAAIYAATVDASGGIALGLGSFALAVVLYVWTALALSAVFGKSGLAGWQAWVPGLNVFVLLQLGGLSGWLVLLVLFPILGPLALWVFIVVACFRVNVAFGFGGAMTVLAAVALPIWASVLGFGSARWIGAPAHAAGTHPVGPRRTADGPFGATPASPTRTADRDPLAARLGNVAPGAAPDPASPNLAAFSSFPLPVPEADLEPISSVPLSVPRPAHAPMPDIDPAPPVPVPAAPVSAARSDGGFDLGAVSELTSDVTDAVPGAPAPVPATVARPAEPAASEFSDFSEYTEITDQPESAAAPVSAARPASAVPPVSSVPLSSFVPPSGEPALMWTTPPLTRVPAASPKPATEEPWAPPRRSSAGAAEDPQAFSESSAEVSAIAGAPDAGSPRSARGSVSAQHTRPEIPDEPLDQTIITRRKRTAWSLLPPAGAAVPLSSTIVILGRKPSPDAAFPGAQLVSVDDGTISKTHARLELREERWYITDLGSTNGVLFATLMGTEIEATPGVEVEAGERFYLGDAEVRLQRSDG